MNDFTENATITSGDWHTFEIQRYFSGKRSDSERLYFVLLRNSRDGLSAQDVTVTSASVYWWCEI